MYLEKDFEEINFACGGNGNEKELDSNNSKEEYFSLKESDLNLIIELVKLLSRCNKVDVEE